MTITPPHPQRRRALGAALATVLATASATAQQPAPGPLPANLEPIVHAEEILGGDAWRQPKLALSSRRHAEVTTRNGTKTLYGFVAYPDKPGKAPVVLMIPEDQHLNNWARDMADQIASMGYVVVVPDMMSGFGPNGGGRASVPSIRESFRLHATMPKEETGRTADLNVWADWAKKLPQAGDKMAVVGFAWGAGRAAWLASSRQDLSAAFLFYDWVPAGVPVEKITAPVYGFYAEHDPRVTATLEATKAKMAAAGKRYEPVIYPGSEHMFVRLGDEPRNTVPANVLARNKSLARLQELLATM